MFVNFFSVKNIPKDRISKLIISNRINLIMENFKKLTERFRIVFSRLPAGERKLPIVKIDKKIFTWEEAYDEIKKNTKVGKEILKKLKKMGIL